MRMSEVLRLASYVDFKARALLASEATRYRCGWVWWILEPVLLISVFYVVFSFILTGRGDGFIDSLAVGVVTWIWFSNCVSNSIDSIRGSTGLINQVPIPKIVFPLVSVYAGTLKASLSFVVLITWLAWSLGVAPTWFWLPILFLVQLLITAGVALLAALCTTFVPDLRFVINSLMQLTMFCSGVFYDLSMLPESYRQYFLLNPIAFLINSYKQALVWETAPPLTELSVALLAALALCGFATALLIRLDQRVTRRVVG